MLDQMMASSGLPEREKRRLRAVTDGKPMPPRKGATNKSVPPSQLPYDNPLRGVPLNPRLCPTPTIRSKAGVLESVGGSMERPQFRGARPGQDREAEKDRLANTMTYGQAQLPAAAAGPSASARLRANKSSAPVPVDLSEEARLHKAICGEIDERREFLQSMRAAGRAAEHEAAIGAQIEERLGELAQLERMMAS